MDTLKPFSTSQLLTLGIRPSTEPTKENLRETLRGIAIRKEPRSSVALLALRSNNTHRMRQSVLTFMDPSPEVLYQRIVSVAKGDDRYIFTALTAVIESVKREEKATISIVKRGRRFRKDLIKRKNSKCLTLFDKCLSKQLA